jgi:hypothetical protein
MKSVKKIIALVGSMLALPAIASADVANLKDLINQLRDIIDALIPLLFGIALLGFIWGVVKYIWSGGNAETVKKARVYIVFSIVALAVMLSVWSLAFFVKDSFFPSAPASYLNNSNPTQAAPNSYSNMTRCTNGLCPNGGVCSYGYCVSQN